MKNNIVLNDLFDYKNRMIYQIDGFFKFSLDSILLSEYVSINNKTKNILDLCTGNASVPLILSTKTNAHIDCFEIQEPIYELGKESIKYNNLENQISIYNEDIKDIDKVLSDKKYDIITCNPPYFKVSDNNFINNTKELSYARHEILIDLESIFKIASAHLDDKKAFYLVHQASRIDEIIIIANKYNLGVKKITFVKTTFKNKPSIVLLKCIKNSKFGIIVDDVNIENLKTYQNMFKEEL